MANLATVEKRDAAGSRAPTNVVFVPLVMQSFSNWTVPGVRSAIDDHEAGNFGRSAMLVDAMGRDDRIKGVLGTRVKALLGKNGLPFTVQPSDSGNKARTKVVAKQLAPLWWKILPDSTLGALVRDAAMLGAALARVLWTLVDGAWLPSLEPVPPFALYHDPAGSAGNPPGYYLQTLTGPIYIDPADPHWFLYTPGGSRSWMEGAVRALGMPFVMRQFSHRDWVRYCEKHGMPIITVTEPSDANPASKDAFYKRLSTLGSESVIRLPTRSDGIGFKLDMLEAKDSSWQAFDHFISKLDVAIAVVLLGQNMTTDPIAHATGVNNARLVRQDYLDADVQPLATELREQIIKPWGRFNVAGWDDDLAPWPNWDTRPPEDQKAKAATYIAVGEAITKMTDAGLAVDAKLVAEQFGIPLIAGQDTAQAGQFYKYHFDYGIITLNEARARLGLPPLPNGDVPPLPLASAGGPPGAKPALGDPNADPNADPNVDPNADDNAQPPAPDAKGAGRGTDELLTVDHLDERAAKTDGFHDGQAYADKLAEASRERARDVMSADLDVLLEAVTAASSYSDLKARLIETYRAMSADDLAEVTRKALLMAELAGRYAVLTDA